MVLGTKPVNGKSGSKGGHCVNVPSEGAGIAGHWRLQQNALSHSLLK
jgi:hypothetical protein